MSFLAAIRFLTVFPVVQNREFSAEELGRSSAWFPLVGLLLGALLVGLDAVLHVPLENEAVINALLIAALVIMTGALHMDGFIDTCDGIFLRRPPEERLRIMSDSRVGGFGVIGACCLLLLKFAALGALTGDWRWIALLLMPVLGRWMMVCLLAAFRYAKETGKGLVFKQQVDGTRVTIASLTAVIVAFVFGGLGGLLVMAVVGLLIFLFALHLDRGLKGLTGDTYGAANELAEVLVLLLVPVFFKATEGGFVFS